MNSLKVEKQLAAKQDLALGKGKVTQSRNGNNIQVDKFNPVESMTLAEARADETAYDGKVVIISDRANGLFEFKTGQIPNGYDIIVSAVNFSLCLVLKVNIFDIADVRQFGAQPLPFDSTEAFKAALSSVTSLVRVPKGVYIISETLEVPRGKTLYGDGCDYWDTYRPAQDRLLKSQDQGTHLLFKGTGAKNYSCINLPNAKEDKSDGTNDLQLLDFTNKDSVMGAPATARQFSVGIVLQENSRLKDLRVVPWFNGIDGYNDFVTLNLADDWDVGIWARGCNEGIIENVQSVGYWRMAGCLVTENDGSYSQRGNNPERLRITNCSFTGVRGLSIRNSPQWTVVSNTANTITCEYNETWTLTSQNTFRIIGDTVMYTFTGHTVSGDNITLTGVSPTISGSPSVIRSPSQGNNFSGTVFENSYAASLEHSSGTPSDELPSAGLPISGAFEIDGFPVRGIKFVNSKFQTTYDKLNTFFGDARDHKFIGCQFENGSLVAYSNTETSGYTGNLRMNNTYISGSVNRVAFTPREAYIDHEQFPTQFTDGSFIMKNWRNTNTELRQYNNKLLTQYRVSDGNIRHYGFDEKLFMQYTGATGELVFRASGGLSLKRESDSANFLRFFDVSGNGACLANFTVGGELASTGNIRPVVDNSTSCGGVAFRWSEVFAANGTINTSDAREKTAVDKLSDDELNASKQLAKEIGSYQWLASIESKGDKARKHIGLTVQRAIEIMEDNNLDAFSYGFICFDEWESEEEQSDDEGNVISPSVEAGDRYGFRYSQLAMFIQAGLNQRLDMLESK